MMKLLITLGLAMLSATSALSLAAAPAAAPAEAPPKVVTVGQVKAVTELMAAMQAEKLMRTITGTSRFNNEKQRAAAFAKLAKVPAAQIHARLAYPLARVISVETAREMTRFYSTIHGKKIVYKMYNTSGTFGDALTPIEKEDERKDMKRPEYLKASKALDVADEVIRHEAFVLLREITKSN